VEVDDGLLDGSAGEGGYLSRDFEARLGCPLGYHLPARHGTHTVGPIWQRGGRREHKLLRHAYRSTFQVARDHGDIHSIALLAISTSAYGFPKADAAEIAMSEMTREALNFDRIVACLFDEESVRLYRMFPDATDRQD
jgi:O-acetyl-ADP-ribose deacetylase